MNLSRLFYASIQGSNKELMETLLVKMVKEYEPWRKSFILQLYENTKDAVEVARRNYLESRLANGLKREMHEIREKYESFSLQNDNQLFLENFAACEELEDETDAAILQLKDRSDEFVALSSGGWPYKVEYLTYDEILRVKLPNYSRFLFDPNIKSFGPISEKWEKLKASFSKEFMNLVNMSPRLSMGRSYLLSAASSMAFSISEAGEEPMDEQPPENAIEDQDSSSTQVVSNDEPIETPGLAPSDTDNTDESKGIPALPRKTTSFIIKTAQAAPSLPLDPYYVNPSQILKPKVKQRRPNSFKRTLSGACSKILNSAAQSAESKRAANRTSNEHQKNSEESVQPAHE